MRRIAAGLAAALLLTTAMARAAGIDVHALWDYGRPAESEARFREALKTATGDDALVLRTQIARTYSLRRRFDEAHAELDAIAPQVAAAGDEVRVHALLERGRTLRSSGRPADARPLFERAVDTAQRAGLERLAADAMHMVALVEPDTDVAIDWHRRTVAYARAAQDPKARGWAAPALNNLGDTLRRARRLDEALAAFREAEQAYAQRDPAGEAVRVARWQVANVLRLLGRVDEALAMQLDLERRNAEAGEPDGYVFEELALLYEALGDATRAAAYRERHRQATPPR